MKRRKFLSLAGGAALLPPLVLLRVAWADDAPRRLVVVMLRGAVDGLNVVVPYGEPAYYDARPTIAIAKPGAENGALALDGNICRCGSHNRIMRAVEKAAAHMRGGA